MCLLTRDIQAATLPLKWYTGIPYCSSSNIQRGQLGDVRTLITVEGEPYQWWIQDFLKPFTHETIHAILIKPQPILVRFGKNKPIIDLLRWTKTTVFSVLVAREGFTISGTGSSQEVGRARTQCKPWNLLMSVINLYHWMKKGTSCWGVGEHGNYEYSYHAGQQEVSKMRAIHDLCYWSV